jgi:hypothetical protein
MNDIEKLLAIEEIKQLKARYCRAIDESAVQFPTGKCILFRSLLIQFQREPLSLPAIVSHSEFPNASHPRAERVLSRNLLAIAKRKLLGYPLRKRLHCVWDYLGSQAGF